MILRAQAALLEAVLERRARKAQQAGNAAGTTDYAATFD